MPNDMSTDTTQATPLTDIHIRRESAARSSCGGIPATFAKAGGPIMTGDDSVESIDFLAGSSPAARR